MKKQIFGLEIAMHDPDLMTAIERTRDLREHVHDLLWMKPTTGEDELLEVVALKHLHRQERRSTQFARDICVEHLHHALGAYFCWCACFATKTLDRIGISRGRSVQHFERDVISRRQMFRQVDRAHSAAPEFAHDAVPRGEDGAGREVHNGRLAADLVGHLQSDRTLRVRAPGTSDTSARFACSVPRMHAAYIVSAVRTPIGKHRGALSTVRADDLAAHVLSAALDRFPGLKSRLDQVIFGATNQAGEDNRNVARMAVLLAGLPYEVPAVTVNRLCGSGMEAICDAAMRIAVGDASVVVAGGVESMTRAPFVMAKSDEAFSRTAPRVFDTSLGWRFENARMAERFPLQSMGETAENVAEKWKITRDDQDAFAALSQQKAGRALAARAFDAEMAPVVIQGKKGDPIVFSQDESPRPDATSLSLGKLAPVFRKGGTVTAGNSSPINDGASAVLVVSEEIVAAEKLEPLARVVAFASVGVEPNFMGEGPIAATKKVLARANWSIDDLDLVELNEAFASQSLACVRGLGLDMSKVNVNGGAIALGHPIGSSGCRIVATLVHAMKARNHKRGLATACIGVGQGIAMLVER